MSGQKNAGLLKQKAPAGRGFSGHEGLSSDVWKTEWAEIKDPNQASDYYDPASLKKMVQEYDDLTEKLPLRFRAWPWETMAYYRNRFDEKERARELYEKIVRQFPDYENIGEVRQSLAT